MTREEAIEILEYHKTECEEDYYVIRAEALDMAIKALKQETIFDKLRVEIMALRNVRAEVVDIYSDVFDDRVILRSDVLEILDKHKAESEEV